MKTRKSSGSKSYHVEGKPRRIITGRELTTIEELEIRLNTLLTLLEERGILNINEFKRLTAMRLHETSKATSFEELEEEL